MNDIIILLDLEDSNLNITDVTITGNKKYVTLETDPTIHFCPVCNFRMHSRGTKTRTINHPILQDTYQLIKELYIRFNARNAGNPTQASIELDELIKTYAYSEYDIFKEFALLLYKHKEPIINSFIMTERVGNGNVYESRLSNGPIEALNRKAKDLKRSGRGYMNFQHLRNRFLFATRIDPSLDGKEPIKWTEEI